MAAASSGAAGASASGSSGSEDPVGDCIRTTHALARIGRLTISTCTKIGRRKTQEDRLVVCPRVLGRDDVSVLCVFDGTVGDHAADFCHQHFPSNLVKLPAFVSAVAGVDAGDVSSAKTAMEQALAQAFAETDAALIESCKSDKVLDYVSSTGVVAVLVGGLLTVAHVGDSRIGLGREEGGSIVGSNLTIDHKPDKPAELRRIEAAGGSLTYLHGGKPFIRGGDFTARQARGDRPMQLNYSRAFGGKDLKPFGLSAEPSVSHVDLTADHRVVILASDGLWDVVSAEHAAAKACSCKAGGVDPSDCLVDAALDAHVAAGSVDNVTVVTAFL